MFAARNISLCTKDCVCLFVCPTGATDTENGQIDAEKCLDGCRLCVDACPSHAIYLVYERLRQTETPGDRMVDYFAEMLRDKAELSLQSGLLRDGAESKTTADFFAAFQQSGGVLGEDCIRESGFLYPETEKLREIFESGLLQRLYKQRFSDIQNLERLFESLLAGLQLNKDCGDIAVRVCSECGYISLDPVDKGCPHCSSEQFEAF